MSPLDRDADEFQFLLLKVKIDVWSDRNATSKRDAFALDDLLQPRRDFLQLLFLCLGRHVDYLEVQIETCGRILNLLTKGFALLRFFFSSSIRFVSSGPGAVIASNFSISASTGLSFLGNSNHLPAPFLDDPGEWLLIGEML